MGIFYWALWNIVFLLGLSPRLVSHSAYTHRVRLEKPLLGLGSVGVTSAGWAQPWGSAAERLSPFPFSFFPSFSFCPFFFLFSFSPSLIPFLFSFLPLSSFDRFSHPVWPQIQCVTEDDPEFPNPLLLCPKWEVGYRSTPLSAHLVLEMERRF